jgi:Tol biopolymer transport system component
MTRHDEFDRSLAGWFEAEARPAASADVLDRALRATAARRPRPVLVAGLGSHWVGGSVGPTSGAGVATLGRTGLRTSMALLLVVLGLIVLAGAVLVGGRWLQTTPSPAVDLGIFEPAAGRIVTGGVDGIWAVDPAPTTNRGIRFTSTTGRPLAWSRDGTRLLLQKSDGNLSVLDADGSETKVTENLSALRGIAGSGRPVGATISPDGSRVVFAGLAKESSFCHDGALFSVGADGGPVELFWKSHSAHNGIVKGPTFSPDGTRIALIDGYCDNGHSVWVMNADGSDAHQILTEDATLVAGRADGFGYGMGGGHAYGLAWSPVGDRIALAYERNIFTFAPDGSDVRLVRPGGTTGIFWAPDGSQIETMGPWHPGTPAPR